MNRQCAKLLATISLCLLSFNGTALDSDRQQKIYIESDTAELNRQKRMTVFRGNVKIDQGTTHIEADEVILHFDQQDKIREAIAKGHLAHYQTQPETGQPLFHAKAKRIHYHFDRDEIELDGQAKAHQGNNQFSGPHILYHVKTQTILSAQQASGRTTIVLDPQSQYWRQSKP